MSDSTLSTLYWESIGGVKTHGELGQTGASTRYFTSQGYAFNHARGAGVLGALLVPFPGGQTSTGGVMTGGRVVALPGLSGVGYGGGSTDPDLALPAVALNTFAMTIAQVGRAAIVLPAVTGMGDGLGGAVGTIGGTPERPVHLPGLVGIGFGGARGGGRLAAVTLIAGGLSDGHGASRLLKLPGLRAYGTGAVTGETGHAAIRLPALAKMNQHGRAAIALPALTFTGSASSPLPAVALQGWCWNPKTNAATAYANYPYRTFLRFRDHYYGIGWDGNLYLLEGADDSGAPIAWSFETGLDDFESPAQKGIMAAYVDGVLERGASLTMIDDDSVRYEYALYQPTNVKNFENFRVDMGRGVRTRNVGIAMQNAAGGAAEIDGISFHYVISKRNI